MSSPRLTAKITSLIVSRTVSGAAEEEAAASCAGDGNCVGLVLKTMGFGNGSCLAALGALGLGGVGMMRSQKDAMEQARCVRLRGVG